MTLPLPARPLLCEFRFPDGMFLPHLATALNPSSGFRPIRSWRNGVPRRIRKSPRLRSVSPEEQPEVASKEEEAEIEEIFSFRPWDVPWDWKVTALVMTPYLMSILLSGTVKSTEKGYVLPSIGGEGAAIMFFIDQSLKAMVKLSVLYFFVSQHQPFPDDVFSFRWNQPFDLRRGWLLWAGGGLFIATCTSFLVEAILSGSLGSQTQTEGESLARLLPFIGSSTISTFSLMGALGVVAPVCEEILYRGFLLTSLTKRLSPSISIILSSALFTLAHLSPGKSLEIFIFGAVLGIVYAQTRNLLTPIFMHAFWNLGVILSLAVLQMMGHNIQMYLTM